jgi:hypothetical protein
VIYLRLVKSVQAAGERTKMEANHPAKAPLRLRLSAALHQNEEPGSRGDVAYLIYLIGCYVRCWFALLERVMTSGRSLSMMETEWASP